MYMRLSWFRIDKLRQRFLIFFFIEKKKRIWKKERNANTMQFSSGLIFWKKNCHHDWWECIYTNVINEELKRKFLLLRKQKGGCQLVKVTEGAGRIRAELETVGRFGERKTKFYQIQAFQWPEILVYKALLLKKKELSLYTSSSPQLG